MVPAGALLDLSSAWPAVRAEPGEVVLREGNPADQLLVLVEGALEVRRGDDVVAVIDRPGSCIGEIGLLLGTAHTADVVATSPSTLRVLDGARAAITTDASLLLPVAAILASRLRLVTAYLSDLRSQYAESDHGLGMVSAVLGSLSQHQGGELEPGSEREPDAPY